MFDMKGRAAIVTGSATGVGAATALMLADIGCNVTVNYTKSRDEAEDVASQIRAKGVEAICVQADVGDDVQCRKLVADTMARWNRVDALVNNAGTTIFRSGDDLDLVQAEDFQRIYQVNVVGPYQMARAVAPIMRKQVHAGDKRKGSVVNVSSIAGLMAVGSSIPYMCSKGALNTLTLALAKSLSPEIRVNTICPGFIQTRWLQGGMGADNYAKAKAGQEKSSPLQQAGTPEHMAEVIVFFTASANNVTGEILTSDAGFHLGALPLVGSR